MPKMPTILEIQEPKMTYCKKYNIHCECAKCEKACWKFLSITKVTYCEEVCLGPKTREKNLRCEPIFTYNQRNNAL